MLVPLLLALFLDAPQRERQGSLAETKGRLGLTRPVARQGAVGRLADLARRIPPETWHVNAEALFLEYLGHMRIDVGCTTPQPTDPLITWLGNRVLPQPHYYDPTPFELSELRDWYVATGPDLDRLDLEGALREAETWHLGLRVLEESAQAVPNVDIVHTWPDGWTIQRYRRNQLDTLHLEGQSMGNCMARGVYDAQVQQRDHLVYSIRKPPVNPGGSTVPVLMASLILDDPPERIPELIRLFLVWLDEVFKPNRLERQLGPLPVDMFFWILDKKKHGWRYYNPDSCLAMGGHTEESQALLRELTSAQTAAFIDWLVSTGELHGVWGEFKGRNNLPVSPRYRERALTLARMPHWLDARIVGDPTLLFLYRPDDEEFSFLWSDGALSTSRLAVQFDPEGSLDSEDNQERRRQHRSLNFLAELLDGNTCDEVDQNLLALGGEEVASRAFDLVLRSGSPRTVFVFLQKFVPASQIPGISERLRAWIRELLTTPLPEDDPLWRINESGAKIVQLIERLVSANVGEGLVEVLLDSPLLANQEFARGVVQRFLESWSKDYPKLSDDDHVQLLCSLTEAQRVKVAGLMAAYPESSLNLFHTLVISMGQNPSVREALRTGHEDGEDIFAVLVPTSIFSMFPSAKVEATGVWFQAWIKLVADLDDEDAQEVIRRVVESHSKMFKALFESWASLSNRNDGDLATLSNLFARRAIDEDLVVLCGPWSAYLAGICGYHNDELREAAAKHPEVAVLWALNMDQEPHPVTRAGACAFFGQAISYAAWVDNGPSKEALARVKKTQEGKGWYDSAIFDVWQRHVAPGEQSGFAQLTGTEAQIADELDHELYKRPSGKAWLPPELRPWLDLMVQETVDVARDLRWLAEQLGIDPHNVTVWCSLVEGLGQIVAQDMREGPVWRTDRSSNSERNDALPVLAWRGQRWLAQWPRSGEGVPTRDTVVRAFPEALLRYRELPTNREGTTRLKDLGKWKDEVPWAVEGRLLVPEHLGWPPKGHPWSNASLDYRDLAHMAGWGLSQDRYYPLMDVHQGLSGSVKRTMLRHWPVSRALRLLRQGHYRTGPLKPLTAIGGETTAVILCPPGDVEEIHSLWHSYAGYLPRDIYGLTFKGWKIERFDFRHYPQMPPEDQVPPLWFP